MRPEHDPSRYRTTPRTLEEAFGPGARWAPERRPQRAIRIWCYSGLVLLACFVLFYVFTAV
jgi:hypothetical protein